ncbi:hypothetical protein N9Z85_05480, partial [Akkermansiaceae bacterium]|nr:hypothetical protein [Akkermansiaceae bacterium]
MRRYKLPLLAIAILGIVAFFFFKSRQKGRETDTLVSEVVGGEELILKLTPMLGEISRDLLNLQLHGSSNEFADSVTVRDLEGEVSFEAKPPAGQLITGQELNLAKASRQISGAEL